MMFVPILVKKINCKGAISRLISSFYPVSIYLKVFVLIVLWFSSIAVPPYHHLINFFHNNFHVPFPFNTHDQATANLRSKKKLYRFRLDIDTTCTTQISESFRSTWIAHRPDTFSSHRCLIDVNPRGYLLSESYLDERMIGLPVCVISTHFDDAAH